MAKASINLVDQREGNYVELEIYQVDAFTSHAFKGNPAAVCITENGLDDALMLKIASEMAVSETAFLSLSDWRLRWFTPQTEVALCGHGTLATAHILRKKGLAHEGDILAFHTQSGILNATILSDAIELDFPTPHLVQCVNPDPALLGALGLTRSQVVDSYSFESKLMLVVERSETVHAIAPNYEQLKQLKGRGVVVSAQSEQPETDIVSRYFAPWVGVNEDYVTGSAHCALAAYWSEKLNKAVLCGYQASSRGGVINMELQGNRRIKLSGQAVIVVHGKLLIPPSDR